MEYTYFDFADYMVNNNFCGYNPQMKDYQSLRMEYEQNVQTQLLMNAIMEERETNRLRTARVNLPDYRGIDGRLHAGGEYMIEATCLGDTHNRYVPARPKPKTYKEQVAENEKKWLNDYLNRNCMKIIYESKPIQGVTLKVITFDEEKFFQKYIDTE